MAWFGAESEALRHSLLLMAVYWTVFLVLFVITLAIVLIDIRYIRLQYIMGERAIYQQTLGDETLRRDLRKSQQTSPPPDAKL
ncbi:MAG: hypothetical protein HZB26_17685 [Candidatus Hydrogenedentes bacterium]|nr:hypothetical protein [Candidatus Hydrogenedentota bacterium]